MLSHHQSLSLGWCICLSLRTYLHSAGFQLIAQGSECSLRSNAILFLVSEAFLAQSLLVDSFHTLGCLQLPTGGISQVLLVGAYTLCLHYNCSWEFSGNVTSLLGNPSSCWGQLVDFQFSDILWKELKLFIYNVWISTLKSECWHDSGTWHRKSHDDGCTIWKMT